MSSGAEIWNAFTTRLGEAQATLTADGAPVGAFDQAEQPVAPHRGTAHHRGQVAAQRPAQCDRKRENKEEFSHGSHPSACVRAA